MEDDFELICDIIGPKALWPQSIVQAYESSHMTNGQRFKLVIFNYVNGLNPIIFEEFCIARRTLRDDAALNHIQRISQICEAGILNRRTWYSFNVANTCWQYLDGSTKYY